MKLESISIKSADRWDKWTGYQGTIMFSGDLGRVQIRTDDDLSRKILDVCAEQISAAARQVATHMTADLLEAQPVKSLEGRKGE